MPEQKKVEYSQLEAGYEFSPASYKLDPATVAAYCQAVEETSSLYQDTGLVPPMAIAAFAMATLSEGLSLPSGAIHVSQEIEFIHTVSIGDTITCHSRVSRRQNRGKFHLLAIDLNVFNQDGRAVMAGKTSFILPAQYEEGQ